MASLPFTTTIDHPDQSAAQYIRLCMKNKPKLPVERNEIHSAKIARAIDASLVYILAVLKRVVLQ